MAPLNKLDAWYQPEWSQEVHRHEAYQRIHDAAAQSTVGDLRVHSELPTKYHALLAGPSWISLLTRLPLVGMAYTVHKSLRELYPRRLPVFTSLKLLELYAWAAVALAINEAADDRHLQVLLDPKRIEIEGKCIRIKRNRFSGQRKDSYERELDAAIHGLEGKRARLWAQLFNLRTAGYDQCDLVGKLRWWNNHIWSDEATWNRAAVAWIPSDGPAPIDKSQAPTELAKELEVSITHLANMTNCRFSESYNDCGWPTWYDFRDYVYIPLAALVASIPFAMLARRSGRRLLYWPMNGLQRVLVGATVYCGVMQRYQHFSYLTTVQAEEEKRLKHIQEVRKRDRSLQ